MRKLLLVTHNAHKVEEFQHLLLQHDIRREVLSLKDIGFHNEIEESGQSFIENANLKIKALEDIWQDDLISDDSGFEIEALQGRPGVYSARYAGDHGNHAANISKVLLEMENEVNRRSQFQTVLAGRWNGKYFCVSGIVQGHVLREVQGWGGFGYDPIFVPNVCSRSFAQLSLDEKGRLSHRGLAFQKWISWIRKCEV